MRFITALVALFMVSSVFAEGMKPAAPGQEMAQISVENAWVRAVPPVSKNTAAYFTLKNKGHKEMVLVGAQSKRARVSELHNVIKKEGMMSMTPVKQVVIPAYGQVDFKPGSYHLMMIDLAKPVKEGEMVGVDLMFKDGSKLSVQVPVKPGAGMGAHHKH